MQFRPAAPATAAKAGAVITGKTARDIAASIEAQIREGGLAPGVQLPTIRALASEIGVSPMTVATAYRELRRRGLLLSAGRRGTRVSVQPPLTVRPGPPTPEGARDVATGNPDPELLPPVAAALAAVDPRPRAQPASGKLDQLVALAEAHFAADSIPTEALAVVGGALDGVERVLAAHLAPGDAVAVEDPVFVRVLDLLRALGLVPQPVTVDDDGPLPEALEAALAAGAAAFIVTPRWQNPFGSCLTEPRASDLRQVLDRYERVLVVEDDHGGLIARERFYSVAAGRSRWTVVRSVSKALGGDLRVAVMTGDPTTIARVEGRQLLGTGWVSHLLQELVVHLWSDPSVQERLDHAATIYDARRLGFMAALREHEIHAHGASGLNVWIPGVEEAATVAALLQRGWAATAGERWRLRSGPAVRITTSTLHDDDSEALANDVVDVLTQRTGVYSG